MSSLIRPSSLRFALSLWAGSVLALYVAYVVQLEPAQWAGVTVWIMFMQSPRLNYSKIIYWSAGTIGGAVYAITLIDWFNPDRFLFLVGLGGWLSLCAYTANLAKSYNAYGAVLAGYTAAIVSLSSIDQPEQVFDIAVNRVSCIFVGMASAILAMIAFLPRHPHWKSTLHRLGTLTQEVCRFASESFSIETKRTSAFSWAAIGSHLSGLEHTLAPTTAESAESRVRAGLARQAVASLFCLLAKAQSIEVHLMRQKNGPSAEARKLVTEIQTAISRVSSAGDNQDFSGTLDSLCKIQRLSRSLLDESEQVPTSFFLFRLEEVTTELKSILAAWSSIHSHQLRAQPSRLAEHQDYPVAFSAALRMVLAIGMTGILWVATGWPSGGQLVLFTAVVCSLLSLQEDPRNLGWRFMGGACLCACAAYLMVFWLLQMGEGFILLACVLGLFLVPATYVYRHSSLIGGAVPCMLLFYNLVISSNEMRYDIGAFLNNALAYILATGISFFAFHAILPPKPSARCANILRATWDDIGEMNASVGELAEQEWTSLLCDRIRLLHRYGHRSDLAEYDSEARLALQIGLRRLKLQSLFSVATDPGLRSILQPVLHGMSKIAHSPDLVRHAVAEGCHHLSQLPATRHNSSLRRETLVELSETESLLLERMSPNHV